MSLTPRYQTASLRLDDKDNWYNERIQNLGNVSGNLLVNPSNGGFIIMNITSALTLSFDLTSLPVGFVTAWTMKVTGGLNGITWPVGTLFVEGVAPEFTSNKDFIFCVYDGTDLVVSSVKDYQVLI